MDARPDILNHNTETVPRLYRVARSGARYERTLRLLEQAKEMNPSIPTKTGVMVGLGESTDELLAVFRDLATRKVDILTVGQYLRPSRDHLPVARLYTPDEFHMLKHEAMQDGLQTRRVRTAGAFQLSRPRAGRRRHRRACHLIHSRATVYVASFSAALPREVQRDLLKASGEQPRRRNARPLSGGTERRDLTITVSSRPSYFTSGPRVT